MQNHALCNLWTVSSILRNNCRLLKQALRIMRVTAFLLTICCLQVSASGWSQKITFSGNDVPLETVFSEIRKQTDYFIAYDPAMLNNASPVTVHSVNEDLTDFLNVVFKDQPLTWSIKKSTIFVQEKSEREPRFKIIMNARPPIRGQVKDGNGKPLSDVNIVVQGTNRGTVTNANGEFELEVKQGETIEISAVGYGKKTLKISSSDELNIDLQLVSSPLDEVQIIAYGQTTKRFNTGSVTTIKGEDIAKQPVNNPLMALQGRVPGMVIQQDVGVPGGAISVQIRGRSSLGFNVGNDPLYIVDGVQYPSSQLPGLGAQVLGNVPSSPGNPLSFLNSAEIESIDVLKDADATAIYGSRGANGVVLITTKKGRAGKIQTDINITHGISKVGKKLDLLNLREYLDMRYEALKNDGVDINDPFIYAPDLTVWDTTRYTDIQDVLIGGTAHYSDAQLSVSGGNANTQFLVGTGYHRETTVFPGTYNDQKASVRFSINSASLNKKFKLQFSGSYLFDDNRLPYEDPFTFNLKAPPDIPKFYNEDGTYNWENSTWDNPLAALKRDFRARTNRLSANAQLSYSILPGLEVKSSFGYNELQSKQLTKEPLSARDPATWVFSQNVSNFANNNQRSWIIEPQIRYQRQERFGEFTALVGATVQQTNNDGYTLYAEGFANERQMEDVRSAAVINFTNTILDKYKYAAAFGRFTYNLSDKYIVNVTGRRDGSSRFGPANRYSNFGSVGGAWIFSQEKFVRRTLPMLSFGKLRASYGLTGNDQLPNYLYMNLVSPIGQPYQGTRGLTVNRVYNPNLQWEENRKLEMAIELGLFKDRILLSADYYRNRSSNQLVIQSLPSTTGFTGYQNNLDALVQNKGWEASLSTTNIQTQNFKWTTSFNITIPSNKLLKFPGLETSVNYRYVYKVGEPITAARLYEFAGVDPSTGVYQFVDSSGKPSSQGDINSTVSVSGTPKYYGGFLNTISYKGLQLDLFFYFVKQTAPQALYFFMPGDYGNQPRTVLDRWQTPGDQTNIQKFSQTFGDVRTGYDFATSSNQSWGDASFVRLKNIALSYQFPSRWTNAAHLQTCRVFLQAQNLLTFTKYKGWDPESHSVTSLPPLKTVIAGINVTF